VSFFDTFFYVIQGYHIVFPDAGSIMAILQLSAGDVNDVNIRF
jgi:hypothetical protein